jgi:hypothetical protein
MSRALPVQPKRPGASYAVAVPTYISPFVIKHQSYEDEQREYWNRIMKDKTYYDSCQNAYHQVEDKRKDFEDLHLMWSRARERYATSGDVGHLLVMLGYVTDTNPPEKTPAEIREIEARLLAEAKQRSKKFPEGFWRAFFHSPLGDPRFQMRAPSIFRRRGRAG